MLLGTSSNLFTARHPCSEGPNLHRTFVGAAQPSAGAIRKYFAEGLLKLFVNVKYLFLKIHQFDKIYVFCKVKNLFLKFYLFFVAESLRSEVCCSRRHVVNEAAK